MSQAVKFEDVDKRVANHIYNILNNLADRDRYGTLKAIAALAEPNNNEKISPHHMEIIEELGFLQLFPTGRQEDNNPGLEIKDLANLAEGRTEFGNIPKIKSEAKLQLHPEVAAVVKKCLKIDPDRPFMIELESPHTIERNHADSIKSGRGWQGAGM